MRISKMHTGEKPNKCHMCDKAFIYLKDIKRHTTVHMRDRLYVCHIYDKAFYRSHTHTHTHTFNGPLSGTTWVSRYQKGKTNLDFTEARDSEWQWHQLGRKQVCTSLQTDNHASTPPLSFYRLCPSCRPTNSVKALKATSEHLKSHESALGIETI